MNIENLGREVERWAGGVDFIHIIVVLAVGILAYNITGIVVSWLTHLLSRGPKKGENKNERKKRLKTLSDLFTAVIKVIIVLTVIFTILNAFNINLAPLLASAGVAGIAIGFGAQNVIRDILAGFFIILENQYRVGDYVDISGPGIPVGGGEGTVEKLSIRSTSLRDRNGDVHFIPNGSIVQIVNKTLGYSKVHFKFAVSRDTDTEQLIKIINDLGRTIAKEPEWKNKIIDPPHFVEIGRIGKSGYNVTISGITQPSDQWHVGSEFRTRLIERLREEGIEVVDVLGS